ncbi:hypothetical protein F2Q70_00012372 [Brassica cretica]|uniref:Uncharacterized protein n=1 Tax=Brassica cretica TaxID=69181 RepID=A0A8S9LR10_BRACR|nr:hypothetical protein F2Q68_00005458 [Brassica cretica]KAF2609775.1 hypothetical protein F2Q70_00012372 [Brassica cretica]
MVRGDTPVRSYDLKTSVSSGCIGGSNQRQSPAEQTPRSHRPGKAPMGTGTSTEEVHRSRNKRSFDPAKSCESD